MKYIPLTQNKYAIVDDEDFEWLNQWKWHFHNRYAVRHTSRKIDRLGKQRKIMMHRIILNTPQNMQTDHKDGNGLNNQKSNLRICNQSENLCNQKLQKKNTSGFRGVNWSKTSKKWQTRIMKENKRYFLGDFDSKEEAAIVYDKAAKKFHKEFARTNI